MTAYRTQCPHCQHQFMLTDGQLARKDGLVRCTQCQQIFSATDQRVADATQSSPTPTTHSFNKKKSLPAADSLIYDDNSDFNDSEADIHKNNNANTFKLDILEDFEKLTSPTLSNHTTTRHTHESTSVNENAWLEQLLHEEKTKELNTSHFDTQKISTMPTTANDVASLLDEFGVDIAPQKPLSEAEYYQKLNQRLTTHSTSEKIAEKSRHSLLPTLLWSLGSVVLVLGLVAQYLAYNRDNLVKNPNQATMLSTLCTGLHLPCQLANADTAAIGVQVNKLEVNADKTDAVITLTNQSKLVQLYPTLRLTLLANNVSVGQLIITPMQYLDTPNLHMSGEQIKPIKLRIDMPRNKFDKITVDKLY